MTGGGGPVHPVSVKGVLVRGGARPRVSDEHRALGWFAVEELDGIPLPGGYAEAVRVAVTRR